MEDHEQTLRERAYFIWEKEGRVDGSHLVHWHRAENEHEATEQEADDISSANIEADHQFVGERDGARRSTDAYPANVSSD